MFFKILVMIKRVNELVPAAKAKGRKRLIAAAAKDSHTLEAVSDAVNAGLVEATLFGDPDSIHKLCEKEGIDSSRFAIIPENDDVVAANRAVRMVHNGEGDILMKGLVSTDVYMRAILNKEYGLVPPKGVLSHLCVFELPMYKKLLLVSDVAVLPYPDLAQKAAIIKYQISVARVLGIERPKVACMAPSEQLLPGITSSTDAAILAKMGDRGQFGDAIVDGPLALDVALMDEIAELKGVKGSPVAGDADCILWPNLDSANAFFKSANQLMKAELACMVLGTTAPCVLTSRGDTRATKLNSIALACLTSK